METQKEANVNNINQPVGVPVNTLNDTLPTPPTGGSNMPQAEQVPVKYAGFWIRWAAVFIDGIVLFFIGFFVGLILGIVGALLGVPESIVTIISQIFGILTSWAYYIFMTYNYKATLGKKAVGIKVFSENLEKPKLGQIILRETVGKIVSYLTLMIGYIMVGFTDKKQGLHDKIADTVVVYNDPNKKTYVWVIVIALILPMIAILGILSAVIIGSLGSAKYRAQEVKVKYEISSILFDSISYADKNSSYIGFQPKANTVACSSDPIVNISKDGKNIAIFLKSCMDGTKYFCADPTKSYIDHDAFTDETYIKSGATVCIQRDNITGEEISNFSTLKEK